MATWPELKSYIKQNYNISNEDDTSLFLTFQTFGDRSQVVLVTHLEQEILPPFVTFASPVADVSSVSAEKVLDEGSFLGVAKIGDRYFVKDIVFLADLDPSEVGAQFEIVTKDADVLENNLTGGDRY